MSNNFTISSLPLKDVIRDLSKEMNTSYIEKCTEYILAIPSHIGSGEVRGINFENGLGIIIYRCKFIESTKLNFTVDKVHPLKYIYTANGTLKHQFSNETNLHKIRARMCALVASEQHNGHILYFEANEEMNIISLEIDREKFIKTSKCQLTNLSDVLQNLFHDTKAQEKFYHDGFYSLEFHRILDSIEDYENDLLLRKFHLEGRALEIFVEQIKLFEDDSKGELDQILLRHNELERIRKLSDHILDNLSSDLSIEALSNQSGLNPSKLQKGFKYLFKKTVGEYISGVRLDSAKMLLVSTDKSIAIIAIEVGFDSPSYFTQLFKLNFKYTPSEFRKLSRGKS